MVEFRQFGDHSYKLQPHELEAVLHLAGDLHVRRISKALIGKQISIVGGALRNALEGLPGGDIDLASDASPEEVRHLLAQSGIRVISTGIRHGTVSAIIDDRSIEITSFRSSGDTSPDLFSDLFARDFTINAFAFDLNSKTFLDPTDGVNDLRGKFLRAVGDPCARVQEDPLRILRMIRFGPAAGRIVDSKTSAAAKSLRSLLTPVSVERIQAELTKIIMSGGAIEAFELMRELKLLEIILPEILPSIGFEQNEFHIHDVFRHTLWVLGRTRMDSKLLRLTALFHDLGKPATVSVGEDGRRHFYQHELVSESLAQSAMKRLRYSNDDIDSVCTLVRLHMRPIDCGSPGVRRLMRDLGDLFPLWREFKAADAPPVLGDADFDERAARFDSLVKEELDRRAKDGKERLTIDGNDIMMLGVPHGPKVGTVLAYLTEVVLDDPDNNNRAFLLSMAKEYIAALD